MAAPKLSAQDKKDLDKFAKYLVYKCIQIIVQSRLGEKVHTQSKAFSSGSDWFNLGIVDIPEVKAETMKVFSGSLALGQNVCVEISLKTAEGETMILETWWLTLTEQCDPGARVSYTIYNRMGVLLKSLFSISRATPAYRLSRRQGPDTFVICYRIYMGDPQTHHLGEGYEKTKVGGVPTPQGTYNLTVVYRTKMLLSPHSSKDFCEDLQENHFNSESSPKKVVESRPCYTAYRERRSSGDDCLMFGEPQDVCATTFTNGSPSDCHLYSCTPLHSAPQHSAPLRKASPDNAQGEDKENLPRPPCYNNSPRICAFAPYLELDGTAAEDDEDVEDDIPFSSLLQPHCPHMDVNGSRARFSSEGDTSQEDTVDARMSDVSRSAGSSSTGNRSTHSQGSGPEDFVMVELKTPFAGPGGNSDLGQFYQECQVAPPLAMFQETTTIQDTLNSITDQLATFEASSRNFDDFMNNLQTSEG